MKLVGYARCSTTDQKAGLEAQIRDLTAAQCDVIFNEEVSSVGARPEFDAALAELQPGDTLVVTKMDRLARSIADLLRLVEDFNKKGICLRILNMGGDVVDTRSATGRLMLNMLASFAQFEREIMLERQKEGIAKARAEGKFKGAVPRVRRRAAEIIDLYERTRSIGAVAREMGVDRGSIRSALKHAGIPVDSTNGRRPGVFFPGRPVERAAAQAAE